MARDEWLSRLQDRDRPDGILATLEDPRLGIRVVLANTVVPPVLTLVSVLACWALGEVAVAGVLTALLAAQLVAGVLFLRTGRVRESVLVQLLALYLAVLAVLVPPTSVLVQRLRAEQGRTRALMRNVLPASIADRLRSGDTAIADDHPALAHLRGRSSAGFGGPT